MRRRSIFKLLAKAVCAAAMEVTGLKPLVAPAAPVIPNPAYFEAEYEVLYLWHPDAISSLMSDTKHS